MESYVKEMYYYPCATFTSNKIDPDPKTTHFFPKKTLQK